ncbi:carbohydrate-binding protein [Pontiella sp.]|uniref:carbohydrate-binding protein n=1 Tax=Pontiella sp. TaxID=2837462 RepID=UPI0035686933
MKKFIAGLAVLLSVGCVHAGPQDFYMSPKGNDRNPGTKEKPFQSLEKARDAVRQVNRGMKDDITVHIAGGTYVFDEAVEFTPADSGMNGHRVIYQAYADHQPVFSGGVRVTGWKPFKDGIYQARLDHDQKLRSLIVDGQRAYMAAMTADAKGGWGTYEVRAGQADWAWESGSSVDGVTFEKRDVPDLGNPEDVEVIRNTKFNSHILCIRDITTDGDKRVLKYQQPYAAIAMHIKYGRSQPSGPHTIVNAFEFLDEPGEFYFDRKKKTVYYIPREGEDLATAEVYAPVNGSLIHIQGESKIARVSHLTFKGLTFAYTESVLPEVDGSFGKSTVQAATFVRAFDEPDWHVTAYRAYDTMPNAVNVYSAQNIEFADNVFKHIGNEGIGFINDVVDSAITGNLLSDIGGAAVHVGHPQHVYEGDEHEHALFAPGVEGVCRNILVENNVMYDMTTLFYGHAPITAYFVDGLQIVRNHIQKCNYTAVSLGWGWNNFDEGYFPDNPTTTCRNNVFSYNRVYDCMRMLHDGGAFYTLGSQPDSVSDGNYVKASTTHFQGVYHPDEGTAWYTGKDYVFEIMPGQDNFELNKWRRKHDNHYRNIYSTSESQKEGAPNCSISDLHVIPNGDWPPAALAIIRAAGPAAEYHPLLKTIPGIVFNDAERYDTDEQIVDPASTGVVHVPPATGGKYEAELAKCSGGAKVEKKHAGFSGTGYVGGFYNTPGAKVTFSVESEEMGTCDVVLRYAAGHKDSTCMGIYVNGEKSEMLTLPSTADWNTWAVQKISVFLEAGVNTVSFKAESKSPDIINIDYIQVSN